MTADQVRQVVEYLKSQVIALAGVAASVSGAILVEMTVPEPWHARLMLVTIAGAVISGIAVRPFVTRDPDRLPEGTLTRSTDQPKGQP